MADIPETAQQPKRVLISYSQESDEHRARIRKLADQLRTHGIDAMIDQYEPHPPEGWPDWMQRQIRQADFILMVFTETYRRRAIGEEQAGVGLGVAWEAKIIRNVIYNAGGSNSRFIPVVFDETHRKLVVEILSDVTSYTLDENKLDATSNDNGYAKLYRHLTGQPHVVKPTLGRPLALPAINTPVETAAARTAGSPTMTVPNSPRDKDAYVPGFEYDVFISYAVRDNTKVDKSGDGWVDVFEARLKEDIQANVKHRTEVAFWRDTSRIKYGDNFSDTIADGVGKCAVMLILLSSQYLASEWCREERAAFFRAMKADPQADHQRLFVVCLTDPSKLGEAPDGLGRVHHAKLWMNDNGIPKKIGHPVPNSEQQEFFDATFLLGYTIAQRLNELRIESENLGLEKSPKPATATLPTIRPAASLPIESSKSCVYLAATWKGTDEGRFTASLALALESSSPPIPTVLITDLPREPDLLRHQIKASKLVVQVVGYCPPLDDAVQTKIAAELQTPLIVWKTDEVGDPTSESHKALLEQARKGSLEEAVRAVTELWQKLNQPEPPKTPVSANRKYLINHLPEDRELAGRVFNWLKNSQRPCARRPIDGATEAELRTWFEKKLIECGDMVLVYGRASRLSMNDEAELCYQVLASRGDLRSRSANWLVVSGPPQPPGSQPDLDVGLPGVAMQTLDLRGVSDTELEAALEAQFGAVIGGQS